MDISGYIDIIITKLLDKITHSNNDVVIYYYILSFCKIL